MALSATGSGASRSVVYRLIADASGVLAGTRAASASMKKLGDDVTAVSKEGEKTRRGFDHMGRTAGAVGLIAAAGLGVMVAKAAEFEQAMSHVAAATHESEENLGLLRDAAIKAGAATQFSATEAAAAIENLAKAGVATADILSGGLKGSLDLAAAGMLPVADAAEDIATALTQFQLSGDKATHVADLLAAGAGKAQGEVSDMAEALKFAGVPAANLGVSIEETAGSIALFAKSGIIGSQAGTSLRGMLSALTSPSKIAAKTLGDLGISVFNSKGEFIGLAGVADQLSSHLGGLTEQERSNALGRIFGNEQLQAANVLYREGGKGVKEWTANVDDAGFAADTAAIKTDNLKGDIERLGGALDTLLIKGGTGSQGFLRGATQSITNAIDALNRLPDGTATALSGMLAITAVTGGGLWFGTKVIRGIADTREALSNMGAAGVTASKGIKAAAAAGAAFSAALVVIQVIKGIQDATEEALPGLNTMKKRLIEIADSGKLASLGTQFDDVGSSIDRIVESQASLTTGFGHVNTTAASDQFGALIGITSKSLDEARNEVAALDEALASLVTSGNPEIAAEALTQIGNASGLTKHQMSDLIGNLPGYNDAVAGLAVDAGLAADAHEGMGKKVKIAGQAIHFTEEQIKDAAKAYQDARDEAAGIAAGFLDISKNADKAKVSLGQWIRQMEKQADALVNVTANIQKAGKRGVSKGLLAELEKLGPAGALRIKQLANATDKEIDRANRAYKRGQKALEAYVDATTTVPDELRTDVKVLSDPAIREAKRIKKAFEVLKHDEIDFKINTRQATAALEAIERRLNRMRKTASLALTVNNTGGGGEFIRRAAGGPVRGPGSGTSDSIPAYLSNGEYVVKAAAVGRYGVAMFDRLNAMHFAQGGPVGGGVSGGGISRADLEHLASNMRPLWGNATILARDLDDIQRLASQDRRAAAGDGIRGWR